MAAATQSLLNARVRVVLRRHFREMPIDIMRGIVTDVTTAGIIISGRHFQEVRDSVSGDYEERPLTKHTKVYFIPYSSMKYIDIIMPESREEDIADKVELNPILETPIKEYTVAPISGRKAR